MVWYMGGNVKNAGNQGGDVENQSGNLGISGRNDIGKQWKWQMQRAERNQNNRKWTNF